MTRQRRPRPAASSASTAVPRTSRMNQLLREVIADELERIGDERLEHIAVTSVDVDKELQRAIVFVDHLGGEEGDAVVLGALGDHRVRLQAAIGRQVRARRTPQLVFKIDEVIRSADRIEGILRSLPPIVEQPDLSDTYVGQDDGDR